jgi:hypothetical protein
MDAYMNGNGNENNGLGYNFTTQQMTLYLFRSDDLVNLMQAHQNEEDEEAQEEAEA